MKLFVSVVLAGAFVVCFGDNNFNDYLSTDRLCPYPFFGVGQHCLYENRANKTWQDAREACQRIGGDLADPFNTYVLLEAIRNKHDTWTDRWYWVGGEIFTKDYNISQWAWFSGRPVTEWQKPNQPDGREGEGCLMLSLEHDPPMYDYYCNEAYMSICQI